MKEKNNSEKIEIALKGNICRAQQRISNSAECREILLFEYTETKALYDELSNHLLNKSNEIFYKHSKHYNHLVYRLYFLEELIGENNLPTNCP